MTTIVYKRKISGIKLESDRLRILTYAIAKKNDKPLKKGLTKMIKQYRDKEQEQRQLEANNNAQECLKTEKAQVDRRSKIKYNFRKPHPLIRFVTEETVAFLFAIDIEQIYRIECWQHIVYVHAEGISRFVSYADFPPVLAVEKPGKRDFVYWRRRWVKKWKKTIAPEFWVKFYTNKFIEAESIEQVTEWRNLIGSFNFCFEETNIQRLRENYLYQVFLKSNSSENKIETSVENK